MVGVVMALTFSAAAALPARSPARLPSPSAQATIPTGPSGSFTETSVACPGTSVYPNPGSRTASPDTQIAFRGIAAAKLTRASVTITGSVSGSHSLWFVADSDGDGGSFYPTAAFQPGESVRIATSFPICDGTGDSATFQVAVPVSGSAPASGPSSTPGSELQHFQSEPELQPPILTVRHADPSAEGDFFLNPKGASAGSGPMIVNGAGQLVWFEPLPSGERSTDLRVQSFDGQPVLTWWQGQVVNGHGVGEDVIMNDHYQVLDVLQAANGDTADLHEFLLSPGATAWITSFRAIRWNLTALGGPSDAAVYDGVVQEIDVRTGNVLFEWDSLDHVSPTLSEIAYSSFSSKPYDYFHVNAIDPSGHGTVLISSRNTDAVYLVDIATGSVIWRLGGKASSFKMGAGTRFALQHDARLRGTSIVTIFDDEDNGKPARLIAIRLDLAHRTAAVIWAYMGPNRTSVEAQGNLQLLSDGNLVAGWGSTTGSPITEETSSGEPLFEASLPKKMNTYRAYRFPWTGLPSGSPSIAARDAPSGTDVYASWNGSTRTAEWTVLGGTSRTSLKPLRNVPAAGFETGIHLPGRLAFVEVEARGGDGHILGKSPVTQVPAAS